MPEHPGETLRPRLARRWLVLLSVLAAVAVGLAVVVAGIVLTEGRRLLTAQDIDASLGAVPGVADADVSYSYRPFSDERRFAVTLDLDPEADASLVAEALADAQDQWRDSGLQDDAITTEAIITVEDEPTLTFAGWDLPAGEMALHVEHWSTVRAALGPEVSVGVITIDGETETLLDAELPPADGTTVTVADLADRIEAAASAAPPAGRWVWSVHTSTISGDGAPQSLIHLLGSRPDPDLLALWRGAATIASSDATAPEVSLRIGGVESPRATLFVRYPDGTETASAQFVGGPHWADATGYAELVAAADDARLWIQVGPTSVAELSAQTCVATSTATDGVVETALLEHLQAMGADFC